MKRPGKARCNCSRRLWIAAACLMLSSGAKGSSVAVAITGDLIVIAADGTLSLTPVNGVSQHLPFCKIRREGDIFYAAVGQYYTPDVKYDLTTIIDGAILKSKTMAGIYSAVEDPVFDKLNAVVKTAKIADPKVYARWLTGIPVVAIAFASFEHNVPVVIIVAFNIDANGNVVHLAERHTFYGVKGQANITFLGYDKEMDAATPRNSWVQKFLPDPIGFSKGLIQLEIDAANREKRYDVGLPISIVRITKDHAGWEPGYEGACRAGQKK